MRIATAHNDALGDLIVVGTPPSFSDAWELFISTTLRLVGNAPLEGIVGGVAGVLDTEKGVLLSAPNLPEWSGKNLKGALEDEFGVPVYMQNDAALVGLGEAVYGAGMGYRHVAYLTVSTGVGGARIVDHRIDEGSYNFEPGHQIIDLDGTRCAECKDGTLESYVSGTSVKERYGMHPHDITDPKIWDEISRLLAVGVANTILHWTPDVVVLGGSMVVRKPGIAVAAVEAYVKEFVSKYLPPPPIVEAKLSDRGGLYGGMAYAKQIRERDKRLQNE